MLEIAKDFQIPIDALTETFCLVGKRGVGKTHTSVVLVEEFLAQELPVCIIDVLGVWWGLRSSRDGKSEGYEVFIFGGEHGDIPLEPGSGVMIADLIVSERIQCILDLSLMNKDQVARFMADFCERLYRKNKSPLHLVLDEADAFAPQKPQRNQSRMLNAVDEIVRRGRAKGLGVMMATQRLAVLNKNVVSQVEVLITLRLVAPNDTKVLDDWVSSHGTAEQRKLLMKSLPSLPVGTAWFWSPGWLDVFKKVKVRQRKTFDSSATPKVGVRVKRPKSIAEIDIDTIATQMKEVIEVQKASDPKALQEKVAELTKELAVETSRAQALEITCSKVTKQRDALKRVLKSNDRNQHNPDKQVGQRQHLDSLRQIQVIVDQALDLEAEPVKCSAKVSGRKQQVSKQNGEMGLVDSKLKTAKHSVKVMKPVDGEEAGLSRPEVRVLSAFFWLKDEQTTPVKVGMLSGYSRKSGAFKNTCSKLRGKGLVEGWDITQRGSDTAFSIGIQARPEGADNREWLRQKLKRAENLILDIAVENYPSRVPIEVVAESSGYSPTSGAFKNALSRLRSLDAVCGYVKDGGIVASEMLV